MLADEPIYEEIDDLLVLMDEICSEGEPDNLQPVCNAISKVRITSCEIYSEGEPDNLKPVCNAISKVRVPPVRSVVKGNWTIYNQSVMPSIR